MKMKPFIKIILISLSILYTNHTFAIDKESIILEQNPEIYNTEKNIQQAQLIETEVILFKEKLLILQENYLLEDDAIILSSLKDIQEIIYILRKIQTTKVNKSTADNVISIAIADLRNINTNTKQHLRTVKEEFTQKRIKYNFLALELSKNVDKIVNGLTLYYSKQAEINTKGRSILLELQVLQGKSKQLQSFYAISFNNHKETKASLIRILQGVKQSIINIKSISKS